MPKILDEALQATLNRIESQPESKKKQAWTALTWVYLTERQLEVNELCHALAIRPGDTFLDEEGLPTSKSLLDFCFGVIIIDEGKSVRLVHKSLQDFFDKQYKSGILFCDGHKGIARTCLTYMGFDRMLHQEDRKRELLQYATKNRGHHVRKSSSDIELADFVYVVNGQHNHFVWFIFLAFKLS